MAKAYVIETANGDIKTTLLLVSPPKVNATVDEKDVLAAVKDQKVLLHIHGGLVPYESALNSAHRLSQTSITPGASYLAERADVQLYLIWPADVLTTMENRLKESVFGKVVEIILTWFQKSATVPGARNGVRGDEETIDYDSLEQHYENELNQAFTRETQENNALVTTPPSDDGQKSFLGLSLVGIAVKATRAIINRRQMNPEGYLFEALVREEVMNASGLGLIGQQIWAQMKDTAMQHATGGFQTFLQEVYATCKDLTLVGHSTGANIITALLPTLKTPAPDLKKLHVVFLAPAVTINTFTAQRHAFETHIQPPLRIYAMAPGVEIQDKISWEGVTFYPGSLLQLVNFVFEDPRPSQVLGLAHYAQPQDFGNLVVEILTKHECKSHGGFDDVQDILKLV